MNTQPGTRVLYLQDMDLIQIELQSIIVSSRLVVDAREVWTKTMKKENYI